jgi:dihydrolipoamide dehydrogenase
VGGHGAALHSRAQNLKTAVFSGEDVGGTCVNRGCVPSKALLAASGRVRDMKNDEHLKSMGIEVQGEVSFSREGIAAHAKNLANRVKGNLEASLVGLGVNVIEGRGVLTGKPHEIKDEKTGKIYTAKVRICKPSSCSSFLATRRIAVANFFLLASFTVISTRLDSPGHHLGPGKHPVRASWHHGR